MGFGFPSRPKVSTEIDTNPRTQQSKGFAFIEMGHIDEARRAVNVLHDQDFMGRKLLVTGAKSAEETRADNEAAEAAAAKKADDDSSAAA